MMVIVSVVVVVLIVGTVFLVKSLSSKPKVTTAAALNDANDKLFSGKNDEAIAVINDQLKAAKSDEDKLALYMALGATYEDKKDNKAALAAFKKAGEIKTAYGINESIARAAEAAGEKAVALDYYQRNRSLIKDGKAGPHRDFLPIVEEAIKRLGGTL